jgi:hypothetical protein
MSAQTLVGDFVADVLDSFEKLDIVLFLAGTATAQRVRAVGEAVHADDVDVEHALAALVSADVLTVEAGEYKVKPNGPWAKHVDALNALYASDRILVVTLMSEAAVKRLRSRADRAFADAFVIRWEKERHEH